MAAVAVAEVMVAAVEAAVEEAAPAAVAAAEAGAANKGIKLVKGRSFGCAFCFSATLIPPYASVHRVHRRRLLNPTRQSPARPSGPCHRTGRNRSVARRSGSGKTTTLKLINGLLTATSGEVRVESIPSGRSGTSSTARRIGGYAIQGCRRLSALHGPTRTSR